MGAGGLNGQIRDHSEHVESVFRYNVNVHGREASSQISERSTETGNQAANDEETMACKRCSNRLSFFNKKNHCQSCRSIFCTSCYVLGCKQNEKSAWCFSCRALRYPIHYKEYLMELKVKELQGYLRAQNIPTFHCNEKRELVDLVLFHAEGRAQARSTSAMPTQPRSHSNRAHEAGAQSRTGSVSRDSSNNSESRQKTSKPVRSLSTLRDIEDVSSLSVKELKYILTANYVDFRGCCEKVELLERVRTLWKSKHEQRSNNTSSQQGNEGNDDDQCKICMDSHIDCVLLECGHMVTCVACGKQLKDCPICRQYISRIVHVFKS